MFSINKKPPRAYSDFLDRARNYINTEALTSKKSGTVKTIRGNPERDRQKEMKRPGESPAGSGRQAREEKRRRELGPHPKAVRARKLRYGRYQELTASIEEIYVNSQSEVDFRRPVPLKGKVLEKHKDKFCLFHNVVGHTTATCFDLKDEIEYLIRRGKLTGYRKEADRGARNPPNREIEGKICTISGGLYLGG